MRIISSEIPAKCFPMVRLVWMQWNYHLATLHMFKRIDFYVSQMVSYIASALNWTTCLWSTCTTVEPQTAFPEKDCLQTIIYVFCILASVFYNNKSWTWHHFNSLYNCHIQNAAYVGLRYLRYLLANNSLCCVTSVCSVALLYVLYFNVPYPLRIHISRRTIRKRLVKRQCCSPPDQYKLLLWFNWVETEFRTLALDTTSLTTLQSPFIVNYFNPMW